MVCPWSSHVWGPKKCKNFGPRWFGSRDNAKKPFSDHFWAIFGFLSKPCEIQMVKAMRLIFWPMIELKTRFDLSHQLVSYLATRWLSARSWENLWTQIRPCSPVLQKKFHKIKNLRDNLYFLVEKVPFWANWVWLFKKPKNRISFLMRTHIEPLWLCGRC